MVSLKKVSTENKELLWNILQNYLYEMTKYYPDDMDENGNYHYVYFDTYFTDLNRTAYLIYNDNVLVGFAMLNPYSYINHQTDQVIAEFSIFPSYRKKHIATKAIQMIFKQHPGRWEIKYNEMNTGAKKLWEGITKQYHPIAHHINNEETVLEFSNK